MLKDRFRILGVCSGQFKDEKTGRQVLYGKVEVLRALSERETKEGWRGNRAQILKATPDFAGLAVVGQTYDCDLSLNPEGGVRVEAGQVVQVAASGPKAVAA
jgi:hypothetical protein